MNQNTLSKVTPIICNRHVWRAYSTRFLAPLVVLVLAFCPRATVYADLPVEAGTARPLAGTRAAVDPDFTETVLPTEHPVPRSNVVAADFNADDRIDLMYVSSSNRLVLIPSALTTEPAPSPSVTVRADETAEWLLAVDLNADSLPDLVGLDSPTQSLWIQLNRGSGQFEPKRLIRLREPVADPLMLAIGSIRENKESAVLIGSATKLVEVSIKELIETNTLEAAVFPLTNRNQQLVTADINGDGTRELIECATEVGFSTCSVRSVLDEVLSESTWLQLPDRFDFRMLLAASLNPDSAEEVLVLDRHYFGWWVGWSAPLTGIERPSIGLPFRDPQSPTRSLEGSRFFTTDVDGDGITEIGLLSSVGSLRVYTARPGLPRRTTSPIVPGPIVGQPLALPGFPEAPGPYVCHNYNPGGKTKWGRLENDDCPSGYAMYASQDNSGMKKPSAYSELYGVCCRLPLPDVVLAEKVEAFDVCPDQYIAIGARNTRRCSTCKQRMICQRINVDRYQLAEERPGTYWGIGMNMPMSRESIAEYDIPLAIRAGVMRVSMFPMDSDGCIGVPAGSLLVRKAKHCHDAGYRELQYRGLPGDPPAGTPVPMFPDCAEMEDIHDPTSGCRLRGPR